MSFVMPLPQAAMNESFNRDANGVRDRADGVEVKHPNVPLLLVWTTRISQERF